MVFEINPLSKSVELLKDFGFFQVILPMILIFAIFFGILEKTQIFGEDKTNINAVIAFVAAFLVITVTDIVEAINTLIPSASFLLVIAVLAVMLLAFFGLNPQDLAGKSKWWAGIGAIVLIIIFLGLIDLSLDVDIPIIHQISQAFIGEAGGTSGVPGAGGVGGPSIGSEALAEAINIGVSLAILLGIPLLVIWFIVKKS